MKRKIRVFALFIFALVIAQTTALGRSDYRTAIAESVVSKLFKAAGQYKFKQPKVRLSGQNKKVAAYYPSSNTIILDEKAYELCRSFGKDSLDALAFLLGHELVHTFQAEIKNGRGATNFLSYDRNLNSSTRIERVADIQGIFMAYLAGYKMEKTVPAMIERVYETYQIRHKTLAGYPSFEERSNSAEEVLVLVGNLIDIFECSNYLVVTQQYSLAVTSLEFVLKYYQGREIYNNLGVLYLFCAMELYNHDTDKYVYPIELDGSTQLRKKEKARGEVELSDFEKTLRSRFLEKASMNFQEALRLDKHYTTALLNLVCAYNLSGKPNDALDYFKKMKLLSKKNRTSPEFERFQLAYGITNALMDNYNEAEKSFLKSAQSSSEFIAVQARFNTDILQNRIVNYIPGKIFVFPPKFIELCKTFELGPMSQWQALELDSDSGVYFKSEKSNMKTTFSFGDRNGSIFSLIRFENKLARNMKLFEEIPSIGELFFYNLVGTPDGYFLKSDKDSLAVKLDEKGKVLELVRYFKHR